MIKLFLNDSDAYLIIDALKLRIAECNDLSENPKYSTPARIQKSLQDTAARCQVIINRLEIDEDETDE